MPNARRLFSPQQRMVKTMSDSEKPTGWWVRTQGGYTIGWLMSKSEQHTNIAHVCTPSGVPFCSIDSFSADVILEQGPVLLGVSVSREEYEAHQKLLAEHAQQRNPILDDVKFIESKMGTRKSAHFDELDKVIETGMAARIEKNAERFDGAMERLSKK